MKHMKKILSLALIALSVMAIAIPALAATVTVNPGSSVTTTKYTSTSFTMRAIGATGDYVEYRVQALTSNGWVIVKEGMLRTDNAVSITPPAGTTQIRITFWAPHTNSAPVYIDL